MPTVHDVAAYILGKSGPMSSMKLQKLCYYSQAWHLAWASEPMFGDRIEAWANGPVIRRLFDMHRGKFEVSTDPYGKLDQLSAEQRSTIDAVLEVYGPLSGRQLSHLTHSEAPWRDARGSLGPTDRSNAEITADALAEFYGALDASEDATEVGSLDWSAWADEPVTS